jgi:hypothetical protein
MQKTTSYMERRIFKIYTINYAIRDQKDKIQSDSRQLEIMKKEIELAVSTDERLHNLKLAYQAGLMVISSYKKEIEQLIENQNNIALELRSLQHLPNFPLQMAQQAYLHDGTDLI